MRIASVIGHKNSGKTTLVVALAREFKRQGRLVGTLKHASHPALVDREGTDTFRHFHEGCAEKALIASPELRVLFERTPDDTGPEDLALRYLSGTDLVLVEGFRRHPVPKVEVYRKEIGVPPLLHSGVADPEHWIAIVTDDTKLRAPCRVLRFQDTMWMPVLAGLIWDRAKVISS